MGIKWHSVADEGYPQRTHLEDGDLIPFLVSTGTHVYPAWRMDDEWGVWNSQLFDFDAYYGYPKDPIIAWAEMPEPYNG